MKRNKIHGFTLVEILVAMSIVAIVATMSFPSFRSNNITNRLNAKAYHLSNVFSYARSEAFRRNSYVSVCATTDGTTCNSSDLATGLIVYSDPTSTGLINNNQILRYYESWNNGDKAKITVNDGSKIFTFNGVPSVIASGNVLVCYPSYNSYTLQINSVGNLNVVYNTGDGGC